MRMYLKYPIAAFKKQIIINEPFVLTNTTHCHVIIVEIDKMANINIRIDDSLKKEADAIFANIGLTASTAITLFYKQVVRTHSIPFDLIADIPNELTVEAIEEGKKIARSGKAGYKSLSALKEALD